MPGGVAQSAGVLIPLLRSLNPRMPGGVPAGRGVLIPLLSKIPSIPSGEQNVPVEASGRGDAKRQGVFFKPTDHTDNIYFIFAFSVCSVYSVVNFNPLTTQTPKLSPSIRGARRAQYTDNIICSIFNICIISCVPRNEVTRFIAIMLGCWDP